MKKRFLAIIAAVFMATSVFGLGLSNVPSSGKEIVIMKGSTVIWHAKNWSMEINTARYTKLVGAGGDDYFKIYKFSGTPITSDTTAPTASWTTFSVVDCEDLTWIWF